MPGLIGVGEFIKETTDDFNSPTTSSFVDRMPQFKEAVNLFEEVILLKNYIFCPLTGV